MNTSLILITAVWALCLFQCLGQRMLITKAMTEELKKTVTWEVIDYEDNIFKGWTVEDYDAYIGQTNPLLDQQQSETLEYDDYNVSLPDAFDARDKWKKCIHPIRHQGKCGSCWSHTSTEVLTDRNCINRSIDVVLSVQDPVSCDKSNQGCTGGSLVGVFEYLAKTGAVSESCFPYVSAESKIVPACPSKCTAAGHEWKKYKCKAGSVKKLVRLNDMKTDLYYNGPIGTHLRVYMDFNYYKGGIYYHRSGEYRAGHYMKVVGWGNVSGVPYWICANTFGTAWGEKGFVKFKMFDCTINEYMVSCVPN